MNIYETIRPFFVTAWEMKVEPKKEKRKLKDFTEILELRILLQDIQKKGDKKFLQKKGGIREAQKLNMQSEWKLHDALGRCCYWKFQKSM